VELRKRSLLARYPGGITVRLDNRVVPASGWRGAGVVPMGSGPHGNHTSITPGRNQGHIAWAWVPYGGFWANVFLPDATQTIVAKSGTDVVLSWPFGMLQSAPAVTGTYTNVPSATSPPTNAPTQAGQFYRVQVQ